MRKNIMIAAALCAALAFPAAAADLTVGKPAPAFTLTDTNGKSHSLSDFKGKYVVLEWINHGCPFVKKHYNTGNMQAAQAQAKSKGAIWLSIASSAKGKEGYMTAEEWNKAITEKKQAGTAVLMDGDGKVGKAYGAKTTPHMFIVNPEGLLIYKGAIDDKPTTADADVKGAKNYVLTALDEAMAGKPVSTAATPPYGCSVKY